MRPVKKGKKKNVPAPLAVPIAAALLFYAFAAVFHFFVSERRLPSLSNCWL